MDENRAERGESLFEYIYGKVCFVLIAVPESGTPSTLKRPSLSYNHRARFASPAVRRLSGGLE